MGNPNPFFSYAVSLCSGGWTEQALTGLVTVMMLMRWQRVNLQRMMNRGTSWKKEVSLYSMLKTVKSTPSLITMDGWSVKARVTELVTAMTYGLEWTSRPTTNQQQNKNINKFPLLDLPVEVLAMILSKMSYQELRNMELSSSFFRYIYNIFNIFNDIFAHMSWHIK